MVLEDNLTKGLGKHELEFGIHFRRNILNSLAKQRYPQAQLDYGTLATALMDPTSSLSKSASRASNRVESRQHVSRHSDVHEHVCEGACSIIATGIRRVTFRTSGM
jgi:hypothetical protein